MKKSHFMGALCACLFATLASTAHSATISLAPDNSSVLLGDQLNIDLWMDFSDEPTLGGGLDVHYDGGVLDFLSFSFDSSFLSVTDPSFTCPGAAGCSPIDQTNTVSNIAFGNFSGISGPYLVGTLVFDTVTSGTTALLSAETTGSAGPFVSATTSLPQAVNYLDASVSVTPVPLPGAIWLMMSGLAFLISIKSRKLVSGCD